MYWTRRVHVIRMPRVKIERVDGEGERNRREDKTELSVLVHTYVYHCARKRVKGRREHAWRADTLTGCEQTMYSACFILSRFINVNIFRPDHSFYPFFLSSPAFPAMRNRREINWLSQPEMFLLSFLTWQFFTFHLLLRLPRHYLPLLPFFLPSFPSPPQPSDLSPYHFSLSANLFPSLSREILSG